MDNSTVQLVGSPCGQHGPYTFYKAFKYVKNGLKRTVRLSEFFFVKLWSDSDLVCIGELQLLWVDKNSEQVLSSLRLYFLPENTPEGRMDHGEDEVLAISEKVVLRLEDLITWITTDAEWTWGRLAKWDAEVKEPKYEKDEGVVLPEGGDKLSDLDKEQITSECDKQRHDLIICKLQDSGCLKSQASLKIFKDEKYNYRGPSVIILSYPSYCRYRAMMKRLEGVEDEYLKHTIVKILGGFAAPGKNTRVLFCRDTFDYPELEGHELLCNHLAPKLKGRPRGRRKKRSLSPGSESNESESSVSNVFSTTKTKIMTEGSPNGLRSEASPRRSTRSLVGNTESKEFLKKLNAFMKSKHTPLGRIPLLGYKELDLYSLFTKVHKLGGYEAVTSNRLWKSIYDDLSGNYASTSAATIIRRHYERFLMPYEKYLKGEEYKPPVQSKRTKSNSGSYSDADSSESTSNSGNSTPIPQLTVISISASDLKEAQTDKSEKAENQNKPEVKTSSLRSVRVKPDRLKDKALTIEKANSETHLPVEVKNETSSINNISTMSNGLTVELIPPRVQNEPEHPPVEKLPRSPPHASQITSLKSTETNPEGKENIATCNTNIGAHFKNVEIDLTEVPYKPKTPEVVHLEQASISNINNPLLQSVKKRKLDILKEGGLEVTPVKPTFDGKDKETRPTVIHNIVSTPNVNQLSITLAPDKQGTLVTSNSIEVTPRTPSDIQTAPSSIMRSKSVSKTALPVKNSFLYMNGQSPPKVVQSRSIYSYSEKVVYGNPKDYFMPPPRPPPQAPKFIDTSARQGGGDILDLTTKSPQKPVVEIMRVPNVSRFMKEPPFRNTAALPVLDARVGSNLEITLVGPNASHVNQKPKYSMNSTPMSHNSSSTPAHSYRHPQKRTFAGTFVPNHKKDENGRLPYHLPPAQHYPRERLQHNAEINSRTLHKDVNAKPSQPKSYAPPVMPGYLTQLSLASKMVPPYPVPSIDPIYYSALQSLYPHTPMPSVPPLFSVPTPEQLQFYTDFVTRNAHMRFPFPYPQDGSSSVTANTETHFKKP